jgi:hypothetical protein
VLPKHRLLALRCLERLKCRNWIALVLPGLRPRKAAQPLTDSAAFTGRSASHASKSRPGLG